jgi:hypothetical protein
MAPSSYSTHFYRKYSTEPRQAFRKSNEVYITLFYL